MRQPATRVSWAVRVHIFKDSDNSKMSEAKSCKRAGCVNLEKRHPKNGYGSPKRMPQRRGNLLSFVQNGFKLQEVRFHCEV